MYGDQAIDNTDDIIDSREILARVDYLAGERDDAEKRVRDAAPGVPTLDARGDLADVDAEVESLQTLLTDAAGYAGDDADDGFVLIRGTYFEDYARELAEDIGSYKSDAGWPHNHIDWRAAADELKIDYSSVDFNGVEYWVR